MTLFTRFSLLCALALGLTLALTGLLAQRKGVTYGAFIRFAVWAIPLVFLCSRLLYVLGGYKSLTGFADVFAFRQGGYSIMGALAGLLLAAWITEKRQHLSPAALADALGLAFPLGLAVERLAETGTGVGMGKEIADFPFLTGLAVKDPDLGIQVHPVYLYEAVTALILLAVMLLWVCRLKNLRPGDTLLIGLTLFGASQVVLESLRNDRHMYIHFVQVEEILALLLLLLPLLVWTLRAAKAGRLGTAGRIVTAVLTVAGVGVGVYMTFRLDRGSEKMMYLAVIIVCMAGLAALALWMCRRSERSEACG